MNNLFQLRLLNADRQVLGWNTVHTDSRGDGQIWALQDFVFEATVSGTGTAVHVYWPSLNVPMTLPLPVPLDVDAGKVYTIPLTHPLLSIRGDGLPVPPVTMATPVSIGVPNTVLGASGKATR